VIIYGLDGRRLLPGPLQDREMRTPELGFEGEHGSCSDLKVAEAIDHQQGARARAFTKRMFIG